MITANNGRRMLSAVSVISNGSNDTVTMCRLAMAKAIRTIAIGSSTKKLNSFWAIGTAFEQACFRLRDPPAVPVTDAEATELAAAPGVEHARTVQSFTHFLAGLEKRNAFLIDGNMFAGTRIAASACGPVLH